MLTFLKIKAEINKKCKTSFHFRTFHANKHVAFYSRKKPSISDYDTKQEEATQLSTENNLINSILPANFASIMAFLLLNFSPH